MRNLHDVGVSLDGAVRILDRKASTEGLESEAKRDNSGSSELHDDELEMLARRSRQDEMRR